MPSRRLCRRNFCCCRGECHRLSRQSEFSLAKVANSEHSTVYATSPISLVGMRAVCHTSRVHSSLENSRYTSRGSSWPVHTLNMLTTRFAKSARHSSSVETPTENPMKELPISFGCKVVLLKLVAVTRERKHHPELWWQIAKSSMSIQLFAILSSWLSTVRLCAVEYSLNNYLSFKIVNFIRAVPAKYFQLPNKCQYPSPGLVK